MTFILIWILILAISSSQAEKIIAQTQPFWPTSPESHIKRDINCETCQTLCEIATNAIKSYKNKKGISKKGLFDVAIMEVANAEHLCTFGYFNHYADKSDFFTHDMVNKCKQIIEHNEDEFERCLFENYNNSKSMSYNFCIPNYCANLWGNGDHPSERESVKARNSRHSTEFWTWNKEQEGIITLPSSLQYKLISKSSEHGPSPGLDSQVKVHYEGKKLNGEVFDSSYKRNQPATFPVNGVIQGWSEGLTYMKEGDNFQFFIPPSLGYGQTGAGNVIGPNELLIFNVNLIEVINSNQEL